MKTRKPRTNLKALFIDYLNNFGGDAKPFSYSMNETILSFAGSDGPNITKRGIEDEEGSISFSDTKEIDKLIKEGCKDNFFTNCENHTPNYPTKTWKEYLEEYTK